MDYRAQVLPGGFQSHAAKGKVMLVLLLTIAYLMGTGVVMAALRRFRAASPIFWFPAILCLMATGTFQIADFALPSDRLYAAMLFVALLSYAASAMLAVNVLNVDSSYTRYLTRPIEDNVPEEKYIAVFILAVSVLVTILYYNAIGYNVFFLLITGNIDQDYSDLRIATYSGDDYFAPGYVNQFKNVLLPITAASVAIWLYRADRKVLFQIYSVVAIVFTVFALLGTGQRGYLIYTAGALAFGYFLYQIGRPSVTRNLYLSFSIVPVIVIFGFMTGAYTGVADNGNGAVLSKIVDRFTSIQQESGMFGFRYIYPLKIAWFTEWWQNIVGILPQSEGSTLAHEVHEAYYGSFRGTAPLSSTGSAYYNGGSTAVVLLFAVMGWAYAYLYKRYLDGRRTVLRAASYGFLFFYLAIYVSDAPTILLDNGVVAVIVFLMMCKFRLLGRSRRDLLVAVR